MSDITRNPVYLFYNGVRFGTETEVLEVVSRPVPDASGRAVKYVQYLLRVRSVLGQLNQVAGQTTDGTMTTLRGRLQAFAGPLQFHSAGFGDLVVNMQPAGPPPGGRRSPVRDAIWGPKPTMLRWKGLGQIAAEVEWQVEVHVPECPGEARFEDFPMEWVYKLTIDVDKGGYTRRSHQGHLAIPQTRARVGLRTLRFSADSWVERVLPPLLVGFRRTRGPVTLSDDKCRIDWSVTDEEVGPNYPPPGVVEVSMEHTATTNTALIGGMWSATLRASYEVGRDTARSVCYQHFLDVLDDKVKQARDTPFNPPGNRVNKGQAVMIRGFSVSEPEIYGRRGASFSATYTFMSSLRDIIKASGMWRQVPGNDWGRWAASLKDTAFHARGNAKLKFDVAGEAIVDLCQPKKDLPALRGGPPRLPKTPYGGVLKNYPVNPTPDPLVSWLDYRSDFRLEQIDETSEHKPLPRKDGGLGEAFLLDRAVVPDLGRVPGEPLRANPAAGLLGKQIGFVSVQPPDHGNATVVQRRARSTWYGWLQGYGVRAGYAVQPPALVAVGGQAVVPANVPGCGLEQGELGSYFGLGVYFARWRLRYLVLGRPDGDIPIMDHPFEGH